MIRRPPRSTLFPTRRSSDLLNAERFSGPDGDQWDFAVIHDPQPAGLCQLTDRGPARHWIWRCHIDTSQQIGRAHGLNSSHSQISYAVFCLKKKTNKKKKYTT